MKEMQQSFWERVQKLKESITGDVEPRPDVRLDTKIIKGALGVSLVQSIVIAIWWSVSDGSFFPWLIPVSTILQVGWFWNKVTDSWKNIGPQYQSLLDSDEPDPEDPKPYFTRPPPTINIQNVGVTGKIEDSTIQLDLQATKKTTGCSDLYDPGYLNGESTESEELNLL